MAMNPSIFLNTQRTTLDTILFFAYRDNKKFTSRGRHYAYLILVLSLMISFRVYSECF